MIAKLIWQTGISFERRIAMALLAAGVLFGLVILFAVAPPDLPFATCAFRSLTGHSCLTCGLTRSLHAVLHGELRASFRYHVFGPAIFIGMLLCFILFSAEAVRGKRFAVLASSKCRNWAIIALAIGWLAVWGIRLAAEWLL